MRIYLENVSGANKICLNLLVPEYVIRNDTEIYLAGGCNQLRNWKIDLNWIVFLYKISAKSK